MQVLFEHGFPVPKIHGYLVYPPCIVMDSLPGTRDMADAPDDKTRLAIGQDYMSAVARMHSLPVEQFVAVGRRRPEPDEDTDLVGLHAYLPHYKRTKGKTEQIGRAT